MKRSPNKNHWSERERATSVADADVLGRPRRGIMKTFLSILSATIFLISGFGCSSARCGKATSASQDREQLRELNDLVVDLTRGQRRTDYADEREPRYRALQKFREMGQAASPAIPALTKLLHNERSALEAASALVSIGPESVKPLMKGLDDKNAEVRFRSAYALGELQTEARAAVPALYKLAQNPAEAEIVREHAIWALGRIEVKSAPNAK